MLAGEPGARPSKARDDLVDDQENAVSVADLTHPRKVVGRRDLNAVRLHDRLGDEGGDELRSFVAYLLFQIVPRGLLPLWIWYCLAILSAASTASEPPLTYITLDNSPGVSSASFAARRTEGSRRLSTVPT